MCCQITGHSFSQPLSTLGQENLGGKLLMSSAIWGDVFYIRPVCLHTAGRISVPINYFSKHFMVFQLVMT